MRDLSSQNGAETSTGSQTGRSPHARGCRRPKPPLAHSTAHSRGVSHRSALQLLWVPNRGQDSGTSAPVWTAERKHESEVRRSPPRQKRRGARGLRSGHCGRPPSPTAARACPSLPARLTVGAPPGVGPRRRECGYLRTAPLAPAPPPATVSILAEQPRPGQTRRTAAGDFQGTF